MSEAHLSFSSAGRAAGDEDELILTSVGIDIGSSTTHMVFSLLTLKRRDSRYVVSERKVLHESAIMLTPFDSGGQLIDADVLRTFIDGEYGLAGLSRGAVDTGALILTGLAVRRDNARQIGEVFADDAGKFVMVTAGDDLEATMAAHGSGTVARSETDGSCLNVDIGGGTTKLSVCSAGRVRGVTAIDIGARIVVLDEAGLVSRVEPAATHIANSLGVELRVGEPLDAKVREALVDAMAGTIFTVATDGPADEVVSELMRLPPLPAWSGEAGTVVFSGGVSEYVYQRERDSFDDLGPYLARAVRKRFAEGGISIATTQSGIRATALGASQHTIQVSGSTIFVDPADVLPLQNVPVVALELDLTSDVIKQAAVTHCVTAGVARAIGYLEHDQPIALALRWTGSASYARLTTFADGIRAGLAERLAAGAALVVVSEGDVGGLIGMHFRDNPDFVNAVVSIDGIQLSDFDYVDIGEMIPTSGAVPVVIKSLVFPVAGDNEFLGAARQHEGLPGQPAVAVLRSGASRDNSRNPRL